MTAPTLRVSVVIPTYRRPADLARCLRGLEQQSELPHEVVLAVRDDDHVTRELLAGFHSAELRFTEVAVGTCNASDARNHALRQTSGEIIAMIDDDTVPRPEWLASLRARFATDESVGGVGGPDWFDGQEIPPVSRPGTVGKVQWWGRRVGNHHQGSNRQLQVEWLKGANMSFRRDALRQGVFGDRLRGEGAQFAEDVALSLAVRRAGWTLVYDPAVAVDHFPGQLVAGVDHRQLADQSSLANAAHNETVAMLDYLPAFRRVVFLAWSVALGTKLLPGFIAALFLAVHGSSDAFRRLRVVLRGRRDGYRTWSAARRSGSEMQAPGGPARPARICLVTHLVTRGDGQGRVNYELARYLAQRGHHVTLVASEVTADLLTEPGIEWIRIPMPKRVPALLRWALFAVGAWWKLAPRLLRTFDIVHLNGAIAPLRAHVNTSHFVHAGWRRAFRAAPSHDRITGWYQQLVTEISRFSERRAYHGAAQVVAVSAVVCQSLNTDVGVPVARLAVIHTGVDAVEFRPRSHDDVNTIRNALGLTSEDFLLLFVGDAKSARKNLDLPLQALTQLGPNFHLAIVGATDGGPYTAMARTLGIESRTHFLGARRDVARCYRDADALICAAHYEPASLVLLEAMASALPVIVTPEVGNAAFVVNGENGFILRSGHDVDGAVTTLAALAADPALRRRIGAHARKTALTLSWERMGQRYEALYTGLRGAA